MALKPRIHKKLDQIGDDDADILNLPLTGFVVGANTTITSSDSILTAFEKTQGQINAINTGLSDYVKKVTGSIKFSFPSSHSFNLTTNNGAFDESSLVLSSTAASLNYGIGSGSTETSVAMNTDGILLQTNSSAFYSIRVESPNGFKIQTLGTGTAGYYATIKADNISTISRTFQIPDADGTFALTSNLTGFVSGTGTSGQISYWNGTTTQTGSNNLFWDISNSRLGVGTNTPLVKLHIVDQSSADPRGMLFDNYGASARFRIRRSNGTIASPTTIVTTDTIGLFATEAYDGTSFVQTANIFSIVRGTVSTGVVPTDLTFSTTTTAGVLTTGMVLSREGRLGIGSQTAPIASLYILKNESSTSWTTTGIGIVQAAGTFTDTSSSGTVTNVYINSYATATLAASSATTFTNAYGSNFEPPTAGTNVTITTGWAARFGGNVRIATGVLQLDGGNIQFSGATRTIGTIDANIFQIQTNSSIRAVFANSALIGLGTSTTPTALLDLTATSLSAAAWTTSGIGIRTRAITFTDTSSSGTVAAQYVNTIGAPTLVASSATTYTLSATMFIGGPVASTNVTQSNPAALVLGSHLYFNIGSTAVVGTFDGSGVSFRTSNTTRFALSSTGVQTHTQSSASSGITPFITYTQAANTGGSAGGLLWTGGAHTSQTTATEITDINYDLSAVLKSVDGTIATNRSFRIQGRTLTPQTSVLTVTNPITLEVTPPIAGSGTTFTNSALAINSTGNIALAVAGNKFFIKEGTNGSLGQTTLVAGTKTITINGLTTSSRAFVQLVTPAGTTSTTSHQAVCTANTLTIQANVAAGTINTADTSTLNYIIFEPAV